MHILHMVKYSSRHTNNFTSKNLIHRSTQTARQHKDTGMKAKKTQKNNQKVQTATVTEENVHSAFTQSAKLGGTG